MCDAARVVHEVPEMILDMILASYFSFALLVLLVSILGAIVVAAIDSPRFEAGHPVPQP